MKSLFLSICCSILLSNICFAMNQSNSTSTGKLDTWENIIPEDIPSAQTIQPTPKNKSIGWFPVLNAVRNSFKKNTPQATVSKTTKSLQASIQAASSISTPTSSIEAQQSIAAPAIAAPSFVITNTSNSQQSPVASPHDASSLMIASEEEQTLLAPIAAAIKKNISRENISLNHAHQPITADQNNNEQIAALAVMSPLRASNHLRAASPLQANCISHRNLALSQAARTVDADNDRDPSTITQTSESHNSLETMCIDRDENASVAEQPHQEPVSLFTMMFNNSCCSCFDFDGTKKKSNNV